MGGMEECTEGRREGGREGRKGEEGVGTCLCERKKNISGVSQLEAG